MSLDYTSLQAAILAKAVRPELTAEVVDFIREAEVLIRTEVEALELRTTLDETDRNSEGIYNLSGQVQTVRAVFGTNSTGDSYPVVLTGLAGIRDLAANADVQKYCVVGQTIEFRGVPATDAEFELVYFGWPDPLSVTSTNELLTSFETLYLYAGLFALYNYTQDLELAQACLSIFNNTASMVNKLTKRRAGGGAVRPAYNFGHIPIGRSR
jgi:hypothetical protein